MGCDIVHLLRTMQDRTPEFNQITKKAAGYLGMVSGYLESHNVGEMLQDANRLIRRFPEHSLMTAAATGLLLGAVIRRK
jgi:ElaB/YqjD/DUF883 family membrane-anchored ribosome-binding protein